MSKKGVLLIVFGALTIAAALIMTGYNLVTDYITGQNAQSTAVSLMTALYETAESESTETVPVTEMVSLPAEAGLLPASVDDYNMETLEINGYRCIGVLYFPSLDLALPVYDEYSMELLSQGPCRYSGTLGEGNLVICAHNSLRHFSRIKYFTENEIIWFIDAAGCQYQYSVCEKRTLEATQIEEMCIPDIESSWDMTLFTCNNGGVTRLAVRCVLVETYSKENAPIKLN